MRIIDALEPPRLGWTGMASSGKKKTTMAKLTRERRLRERRLDKQAKKDARKLAANQPDQPNDVITDDADLEGPGAEKPALAPVVQALDA
jgi:hypothetical protein